MPKDAPATLETIPESRQKILLEYLNSSANYRYAPKWRASSIEYAFRFPSSQSLDFRQWCGKRLFFFVIDDVFIPFAQGQPTNYFKIFFFEKVYGVKMNRSLQVGFDFDRLPSLLAAAVQCHFCSFIPQKNNREPEDVVCGV